MLLFLILHAKLNLGAPEIEKETGQGLVEYALIILLVVVVVIGLLGLLGTQLDNTFSNVASEINALH